MILFALVLALLGPSASLLANEYTPLDTEYLLPQPRSMAASALVKSAGFQYTDAYFITGGLSRTLALNTTFAWHSVLQRWTYIDTGDTWYTPRIGHVAGALSFTPGHVAGALDAATTANASALVIYGGMAVNFDLVLLDSVFVLDYDEAADAWAWRQWNLTTGPSPRAFGTAATHNNQIFMYGGNSGSETNNEMWRLSPSKGWELLPTCASAFCPLACANAIGVMFQDAFVVSGGVQVTTGLILSNTWAYNTTSGEYLSLPVNTTGFTGTYSSCAALVDEHLLTVFGGVGEKHGEAFQANLVQLDVAAAFAAIASDETVEPNLHWVTVQAEGTPTLRVECTATIINSLFTVFGGASSAGVPLNGLWQLHPPTNNLGFPSWLELAGGLTAPEPSARLMSAIAVSQQRIFICFGLSVFFITDSSLGDCWTLELNVTNGWSRIQRPNTPTARQAHSLTAVNDNTLMLYGGCYGDMITSDCTSLSSSNALYRFDTIEYAWELMPLPSTGPASFVRYGHSAHAFHDDSDTVGIFVWGGRLALDSRAPITSPKESLFFFLNGTVADTTVSASASVPPPRSFFASALVKGRFFVYGGVSMLTGQVYNDLWILSSVTPGTASIGTWTEVTTQQPWFVNPRAGAATATIGNKMVVFGGTWVHSKTVTLSELGTLYNTTVVYNTDTNEWSFVCTDNMSPLIYPAGTATGNRMFVFAGGEYVFGSSTAYQMELGCPSGSYGDVASRCTLCPLGTYSTQAGASACTDCPGVSYSSTEGAASLDECDVCQPGTCHYHGVCHLASPGSLAADCDCNAGYLPLDSCHRALAVPIGLGVTAAVLLILLLVFFVRRRSRQFRKTESIYEHLLKESHYQISELSQFWQIDENELKMDRVMARGASGVVWRAVYDEKEVAVKVLHEGLVEMADSSEEFEREIHLMRTLRHANLVPFFGAGVLEGRLPFLVTEWMPRTLRGMLEEEQALASTIRVRLATDLARAVAFLHSRGYIHRDIKSLNCLVSNALSLKLADFGEAKLLSREKVLKGGREDASAMVSGAKNDNSQRTLTIGVGSLLWRAPEIHQKHPFTPAADCFAIAIVLWEIWSPSAELPFSNISFWELPERVIGGVRPTVPIGCLVGDLMEQLWQTDPEARPTAQHALEELRKLDE